MSDDEAPTLPMGPSQPGAMGALGGYRLLELRATGGFGEVHLAEHPLLGRVALKILRRIDEEDEAMFDREGRLVLDHPGIPRILDRGVADGRRYLTMEWIEGRTLQQLLDERPLPEARAAWIGQQVAEVLAHAHARGVVHRDLKPANVLVGADDRAWVLDFGVARHAALPDPQGSGGVVGSPAFMAPEQALQREVGPEADLYALGALLYMAATGEVPIDAPSPVALIAAIPHVPPVDIRRRRADLSPDFARLVMALLAKERAARPGPAARVAHELSSIRRGLGDSGAGPVAGLARAREGAGSILLVSGLDRGDTVAELCDAAVAAEMRVCAATGSDDGAPCATLARALGSAAVPARPGRGPMLAAWREHLLAVLAAGPMLLVIEDADAADDGSWDVIEAIAPSLPGLPLLVVLAASAAPGGSPLHQLATRLADRGLLALQLRGEPAPSRPEPRAPCRSGADLLAAAREAAAAGADRLAGRRYRGALAAGLGAALDRAARVELGTLEVVAGRPLDARPLLAEARVAAIDAGDARAAGRASRQLGLLALAEGELASAEALFEESARHAGRADDREELAALGNNRGLMLRLQDRRVEALAEFVEAEAVWAELGHDGRRAACVNNRALVFQELGRMEEARAAFASALELWRQEGDRGGEANALTNVGGVLGELGDMAGARACYEEAARIRRQLPDARLLATTLANLGAIMTLAGEHEAALVVQGEALGLGRRLGDRAVIANCLDHASGALAGLGRREEAERAQEDALEIRRALGDRYGESMSLLALASLRHAEGRCAEGVDLSRAALELARALCRPPLEAQALIVLGRCLHDVGDPEGIETIGAGLTLADRLESLDLGCQARLRLAEALAATSRERARELAGEAARLARRGAHRQAQVEAMRLWEQLRDG